MTFLGLGKTFPLKKRFIYRVVCGDLIVGIHATMNDAQAQINKCIEKGDQDLKIEKIFIGVR